MTTIRWGRGVLAGGLTLAVLALGACGGVASEESSDSSRITVPDESVAADSTTGTERLDSDQDGLSDAIDLCPETPGEVDGCPDDDGDGMPDVPSDESSPSATATSEPPMVALESDWYGAPAAEVVAELEQRGIVPVEYLRCGEVAEGTIGEIMNTEGQVLLDAAGTSEAGEQVESGTVVEVRVGSGEPCDS